MQSVHSSSIITPILKKNTLKNYEYVTKPFRSQFGELDLDTITPDEILSFLNELTRDVKQSTRKLRYSNLKSFFNFIKNTLESSLENPCEKPMLKKIFKAPKKVPWAMLENDTVDEIIFKTKNPGSRYPEKHIESDGCLLAGSYTNLSDTTSCTNWKNKSHRKSRTVDGTRA